MFDQLSGKVNMFCYQAGQVDRFYYKYTYDADLRLTSVSTSKDSVIWDVDAQYSYFKHGPMARMILGQDMVQGTDYTYTLQGWIKAVNSGSLQPQFDPGADGLTNTTGRDAFGYVLGYNNEDYYAVGTATPEPTYKGTGFDNTARQLWNGNIRSVVTNIGTPSIVPMGSVFQAVLQDRSTTFNFTLCRTFRTNHKAF